MIIPYKRLLALAFRYATLFAAGAAVSRLWKSCGLDYYEDWGHFYALWFPLIYALFSTTYALTATWLEPKLTSEHAERTSRFRRYDDNSYLVLLWVLLLEIAAPSLDNVFLLLAITYLALIVAKGGIFAAYVYQILRTPAAWNQHEAGSEHTHAQTGISTAPPIRQIPLSVKGLLVLAALLVYVGISAYHIQRTSLTGDEPHYLLITHSLWHDHDTNLYNNYENRDYETFFWHELLPAWGDQMSETEIYSYRHKGGFPHFLIPGYVLGGQWGAVLQMNLVTALLMAQVFLLAYELFHSIPAAFAAWLGCAFTIPGMVYMGQLYPEIPAALCAILAVRQIWKLSENRVGRGKAFWRHCLLFGIYLTLLVALKTRYLPLAGMLGLAWAVCLVRGHLRGKRLLWGLFGLLAAAVLGGGIVMLVDRFIFNGGFWERLRDIEFMTWLIRGHNPLHGALGLLFDQEYGVLTYSPIYATALIGIGLLTRKQFRAMWPIIGVLIVNYGVIAMWPLWHAAPTPPARYILPLLPILIAFAARFACSSCRTVQTVVWGVSGIWSAIMAWFLILMPGFRYNWADGTSRFLETASVRIGVNLMKLFPSWIRLSHLTPYVTGLGILLLGGSIFFCRRKNRRFSIASQQGAWELVPVLLVLIAFLGLTGAGIVAGKKLPTGILEMEDTLDVRRLGGIREPKTPDPWVNQAYLHEKKYSGWKLSPGNSLRMRPLVSLGKRVLSVYARAELTDTTKIPRLEVLVNGSVIGDATVTSPDWKAYTVELEAEERRPLLEIICVPELNEDHAIIVDKIRFR